MRHNVISALLAFLAFNTAWFVVYSASLGFGGLVSDRPDELSRVFSVDWTIANTALALHMVSGALLTIGAPIQAMPIVRKKLTGVHRRLGYVLFGLAIVTGLGGLAYIVLRGTVGGWWMSVWFGLYGIAIVVCAAFTIRYAIRKDRARHFAWATRFVILAVASWIYRMHYALWYELTGGIASNKAFTGLFDQIQVVAFFVPYLIAAEILLRWAERPRQNG